jgi:hypothetical protein
MDDENTFRKYRSSAYDRIFLAMRHVPLSTKAARSLPPAAAHGARGSQVRRPAAGILGGPGIVSWLVLVAVSVLGRDLAAQVVTRANPLQPADSRPDDALQTIRQLSVDIRPAAGDLPGDPAAARFAAAGIVHQPPGTSRPWPLHCYWWEAPAVCHRPLYFEQVNLERYGYSCGLAQPLASAAHFFGTIPALPYLLAAEPCRECVYTLGHYRPGSCAPLQRHYPPLSAKGAVVEAGVLTGLIFAIP